MSGGTPFSGAPAICSSGTISEPVCTYDSTADEYTCTTLREAVVHSNCYSAGTDTILLDGPASTATYTFYDISIPGWDTKGLKGDLDVYGDLVIEGTDYRESFVVGTFGVAVGASSTLYSDRIFELHGATSSLTMIDLQVRNGGVNEVAVGGTTVSQSTGGGAIRSEGTLLLERVILYNSFAENSGVDEGGGCLLIASTGSAVIRDSQLDTCEAYKADGGVLHAKGDVVIENSIIARGIATYTFGGCMSVEANLTMSGTDVGNCSATWLGDGIHVDHTSTSSFAYIIESSITESVTTGFAAGGPRGGGAMAVGPNSSVLMENVTLGGNSSAYRGGSVYTYFGTPSVQLMHVTQSSNYSSYGSNGVDCFAGTCQFSESIVTDDGCGFGVSVVGSNLADTSPSCVAAGFTAGSAYLATSHSNTGTNKSNWYVITDPSLSAAVDGSVACPVNDQGGTLRSTTTCELGSYEVP